MCGLCGFCVSAFGSAVGDSDFTFFSSALAVCECVCVGRADSFVSVCAYSTRVRRFFNDARRQTDGQTNAEKQGGDQERRAERDRAKRTHVTRTEGDRNTSSFLFADRNTSLFLFVLVCGRASGPYLTMLRFLNSPNIQAPLVGVGRGIFLFNPCWWWFSLAGCR